MLDYKELIQKGEKNKEWTANFILLLCTLMDIYYLHTQTPPEHSSPIPQASIVDEHLHTLLAASQNVPVDSPTQDEEEPHMQVPETQVSPALVQASPVPHLQTPLVQVSVVPLHASTVAEHLQTLFAESQ